MAVTTSAPPGITFAVAEAVDELRRTNALTQAELAARTGIPTTTLQRRLGDGDFNVTELGAVAVAVGTTVVAIIQRATDIAEHTGEGSST